MRVNTIKAIATKISKRYGVENYVRVEKLDGNKIEIRTELPSYAGGIELQKAITKHYPSAIVENCGGCVYIVYRPL